MKTSHLVIAAAALGAIVWVLKKRSADPESEVSVWSDAFVENIVKPVVNAVSGSRGIRNNNPGNIDRKAGTTWKGAAVDQSGDSRFVVFTAPEWGLRAMARILRTYIGRGQDSIREIISTWAPSVENDTEAYIAAVSRAVGISPDARVTDAELPAVMAAIVKHENGSQPYPLELFVKGIELERTA